MKVCMDKVNEENVEFAISELENFWKIKAEILDMSYDYLRRIESNNDRAKTCSLKLLIKLSILYGKPIDDFLKDE